MSRLRLKGTFSRLRTVARVVSSDVGVEAHRVLQRDPLVPTVVNAILRSHGEVRTDRSGLGTPVRQAVILVSSPPTVYACLVSSRKAERVNRLKWESNSSRPASARPAVYR